MPKPLSGRLDVGIERRILDSGCTVILVTLCGGRLDVLIDGDDEHFPDGAGELCGDERCTKEHEHNHDHDHVEVAVIGLHPFFGREWLASRRAEKAMPMPG